jgi:hypothetical protein
MKKLLFLPFGVIRRKPWIVFILGVVLVVGGIEVSNYFKRQTVMRVEREAAKYGVSVDLLEAACGTWYGEGDWVLTLPTEEADIAIKCWEILHPDEAENDGWLEHQDEIAAMIKKRFRSYKD